AKPEQGEVAEVFGTMLQAQLIVVKNRRQNRIGKTAGISRQHQRQNRIDVTAPAGELERSMLGERRFEEQAGQKKIGAAAAADAFDFVLSRLDVDDAGDRPAIARAKAAGDIGD